MHSRRHLSSLQLSPRTTAPPAAASHQAAHKRTCSPPTPHVAAKPLNPCRPATSRSSASSRRFRLEPRLAAAADTPPRRPHGPPPAAAATASGFNSALTPLALTEPSRAAGVDARLPLRPLLARPPRRPAPAPVLPDTSESDPSSSEDESEPDSDEDADEELLPNSSESDEDPSSRAPASSSDDEPSSPAAAAAWLVVRARTAAARRPRLLMPRSISFSQFLPRALRRTWPQQQAATAQQGAAGESRVCARVCVCAGVQVN